MFTNDGTVRYGSRVETIGAAEFVLDDISISRPSKTIERTNQIDEPSGQVSYPGFVTGSATAQFADASSVPPALGAEFTDDFGYGEETFYIDSVTTPETKDQESKINLTFRKRINAA